MFEIPLYIFLLVYILFVLGIVIFFLFDLYHIIASGELTVISFAATAFIGAIMLGIILYSWYAIAGADINWNTPVFGNSPSFESFDEEF